MDRQVACAHDGRHHRQSGVLVEGRHGLRRGRRHRAHQSLHLLVLLVRLVLLHDLQLVVVDGGGCRSVRMHLLVQGVHALLQGLRLAPRLC
jgi:hypothetical protein